MWSREAVGSVLDRHLLTAFQGTVPFRPRLSYEYEHERAGTVHEEQGGATVLVLYLYPVVPVHDWKWALAQSRVVVTGFVNWMARMSRDCGGEQIVAVRTGTQRRQAKQTEVPVLCTRLVFQGSVYLNVRTGTEDLRR